MGGHLMTVNDQAENDWVADLWGATRSLWIGYNDVAVEGEREWTSGETPGYEDWCGGEPNNANGGEEYAYILAGSVAGGPQWNDMQNLTSWCSQPAFHGVVKVIPEPTTFTLLSLGSLALVVVRRKR
jgi:hypothetical protein